MLVFGSQVKAIQLYEIMRFSLASRGECTFLEVGVVFWRTTISIVTHLQGYRFAQGVTLSLGTIRYTMVTMEASMW